MAIGVFKLMIETATDPTASLIPFVSKWHAALDTDRAGCTAWLTEHNCLQALALFQTCIGDHAAAFPSWEVLLKQSGASDHDGHVLEHLVDALKSSVYIFFLLL